mmetsp:Transcript_15614/g.26558  ORF Transcript_15614/g.26558 Transcript_15614/m.26558 type:complete len:341 (-) Transcript_15614:235-1257(-)
MREGGMCSCGGMFITSRKTFSNSSSSTSPERSRSKEVKDFLTRSMHMASKPLTFANARTRFSFSSTSKSVMNPVHEYHKRKSSKPRSELFCGTYFSHWLRSCFDCPDWIRCCTVASSGTCRSMRVSMTFMISSKLKRPDRSSSWASKISFASTTFSNVMFMSRASLCSCHKGMACVSLRIGFTELVNASRFPPAKTFSKFAFKLRVNSVSKEVVMVRPVSQDLGRRPALKLRELIGSSIGTSSSDSLSGGSTGNLDLNLEISHGCHAKALRIAVSVAFATEGVMVAPGSQMGRPARCGRWFQGRCWRPAEFQGLGFGRQHLLLAASGKLGGGNMPLNTFK